MSHFRVPILGFTCLIVVSAQAFASPEEKIDGEMLPGAVKESVAKRFPNATIMSASKEMDGGELLYEVAIMDTIEPKKEGGKPHKQRVEVSLTPDGAIHEIERQISPKRLPKPVIAALTEKYPKAAVKKAEKIFLVTGEKEKLKYVEVLVTLEDGNRLELGVTSKGEIVKVEKKSGKEQDEDEDGDENEDK